MSVLNPLKPADAHAISNTDLAGPLLFCLLFGGILLLVMTITSYMYEYRYCWQVYMCLQFTDCTWTIIIANILPLHVQMCCPAQWQFAIILLCHVRMFVMHS